MNPVSDNLPRFEQQATYFLKEKASDQTPLPSAPSAPTAPTLRSNKSWQNFLQYTNNPDTKMRRAEMALDRSRIALSTKILANEPQGSIAISPSGNYLVSAHTPGTTLNTMTGFQVLDRDHAILGTIELKVIENTHEDHVVLAFIDKGELRQRGVMDFAMWYITTNTHKKHVMVRNIVNPDLECHLGKTYNMRETPDADLFGDRKTLSAIAQERLTQRGWNLAKS